MLSAWLVPCKVAIALFATLQLGGGIYGEKAFASET